ncbi:glycerophosphodiester phosphodiesterase [uncultured Sphaerochaeta sp.]|uniref:glycerophosphodiester phosphodiesterase n=1 Tax=uncultured Sphaerochaeta sp. TaxID=886478 RepID=UPI00374A646F
MEQLLLEQIRQSDWNPDVWSVHSIRSAYSDSNERANGSIPTGLIYGDESGVPRILRHGFGRPITHPSYLKPSKEQIREAQSFGYQLCAWTVDDREEAKSLLDQGVMGIISNNPKSTEGLVQRLNNQALCKYCSDGTKTGESNTLSLFTTLT